MNKPYELSDYGSKEVDAARAGYELTQSANPGTQITTWDELEESKKHEWCLIATAVISKYFETKMFSSNGVRHIDGNPENKDTNNLITLLDAYEMIPWVHFGVKPGQEMRIDFFTNDYIEINVTDGPILLSKMGIWALQEILAYHLEDDDEEEEGEEEVD